MADEINAKSESTYTPVPEGEYDAVCCDVIDLGMVENKKFGKMEHKCALVFQLDERDEKGKRYEVAQRFTVSLGEKAHLRKFLGMWRGKSYTEDEARQGAPLHKLEGQPAIVAIEHQQGGNGKTYANILAIRMPRKDAPRIKVDGYTRSEYWTKAKQQVQQQRPDEPDDESYFSAIAEEDEIPF